jgi:iron uptake system component EfeO
MWECQVSSLRRPLLGLAMATAFSVVACQAGGASTDPDAGRVAVSVSESGCSPAAVTVASGAVTFVVTNTGTDTAEFEITQGGTKVIDEVENIVPGFVVKMATRLDGGTYEMVCGTTQAAKGALTVSGGPAATPPANTVVAEADLAAARDRYATYVDTQTAALVTAIGTFTAAVENGDLANARALYAPSRIPYERIEPIAELFPDLDQAIDFRPEDFDGGVDDPGFKGFHRIEKGLFADGSTTGLAPLAAELRANVGELQKRLDTLVIDPRVMARGAGELIEEVAQSKMTGEEDRYSKADLYSIDANVDGSAEIVDELRPILTKLDAPYLAKLDAAGAAVEEIVARYATTGGGFKGFDQVSAADLKLLQARLAELSELLSELPGRLGLAA